MAKKIGIVVGVVILLAVVIVGVFLFRLAGMANSIKSKVETMKVVSLAKVADGIYRGNFGDLVIYAKVEAAVKNHRINRIRIMDQKCGKGYEALQTIDRIIKAQSPRVDAVSGASSSSRCIMIAVNRALKSKPVK